MDQRLTILEKDRAHRPLEVSLLFIDQGKRSSGDKTELHAHHFWQLEIIKSGSAFVNFGKGLSELKPEQALLAPPENRHSFTYNAKQQETHFLSMKFMVENLSGDFEARVLESSRELAFLTASLNDLANIKNSMKALRIIEHLIAALVELQFSDRISSAQEPAFVSRVKELAAGENWEKLSSSFVAKKTGYSKVHLSRLFKSETGMTLKAFLDNERYKSAKRLLLYSDYNVSEISERLDFPDPFCFSRFFKRLHGKSPREFKNSL